MEEKTPGMPVPLEIGKAALGQDSVGTDEGLVTRTKIPKHPRTSVQKSKWNIKIIAIKQDGLKYI